MTIIVLLVLLAVGLSAVMALAWWIALRSGRSGWIDAIWSFAVGGAGAFAALAPLDGSNSDAPRQSLVALLAVGWSLRLGFHIVARTMRGGDDPRYAHFRKEWGDDFARRLFWFLQIQAIAAFLLAVTIMAAARNPAVGLGWSDWLGVAILVIAVGGEGVADRQLTRFKGDDRNRGTVCDIGLWSLSRHPNYFFEWLTWVAFAVIAVDFTGSYPWGFAALIGPVFMYWLLVHVSGIPPLEAHMLRSRGDRFRAYQARVNAFWPGPQQTARS